MGFTVTLTTHRRRNDVVNATLSRQLDRNARAVAGTDRQLAKVANSSTGARSVRSELMGAEGSA